MTADGPTAAPPTGGCVPIDAPYPVASGLPGATLSSRPSCGPGWRPGGAWDNTSAVTGLKIAVDGTGIATARCGRQAARPCASGCPPLPCSRDPVPGAPPRSTTPRTPTSPRRRSDTCRSRPNTIFALSWNDSKRALPESQAGSAYYWHVRARPGSPAATVNAAASTRSPATRCRTRRRSARRRRPSPACPSATPTPARSRSAGRTTSTPTWPPRGAARRATKRPRPTGSRWRPIRRSARSSTRGRSTRRPTPRSTGCTPTARTTGACRRWTPRTTG